MVYVGRHKRGLNNNRIGLLHWDGLATASSQSRTPTGTQRTCRAQAERRGVGGVGTPTQLRPRREAVGCFYEHGTRRVGGLNGPDGVGYQGLRSRVGVGAPGRMRRMLQPGSLAWTARTQQLDEGVIMDEINVMVMGPLREGVRGAFVRRHCSASWLRHHRETQGVGVRPTRAQGRQQE